MSMEFIRKTYGVPAKRGQRIRFTRFGDRAIEITQEGTIVGSTGSYIRVRWDAPPHRIATLHPTYEVDYL